MKKPLFKSLAILFVLCLFFAPAVPLRSNVDEADAAGWSCKCKSTVQPDGTSTTACVGDQYKGKPKCTCSNACSTSSTSAS